MLKDVTTSQVCNLTLDFKGTERITLSDLTCKKRNAEFKTVIL